jgi:AcrR family transcriptional regulator
VPVPPRNPSSRRPLTEDEILDAALALLDAGGPEAVTVRRIAAAVDAAPGAVYTYFPDQAAVHHALVDRLLGEAGRRAAAGGSWQAAVEALALALRERLRIHPGAVPLILSAPLTGPHARALEERVRALMADAGLAGDDADHGLHLVKVYVLGAIAMGTGDRQFRWGLGRVLTGLPGPS